MQGMIADVMDRHYILAFSKTSSPTTSALMPMARRFIIHLVCWCVLMPAVSYSQTYEPPSGGPLQLRFNAGLNDAKIRNDNVDFRSRYRPFVGASLVYRPAKILSLHGGVDYALRALQVPNRGLIESHFADFTLAPRLRVAGDFYIKVGVVYSHILKSNWITLDGPSWNGLRRTPVQVHETELNLLAGLEFKLQENVNLAMNYSIPTENGNISHLQLAIHIALTERSSQGPTYKQERAYASQRQIVSLKQNVLLVRLQTSEHKVNAYLRAGEDSKAAEVRTRQEVENKKIIRAFRKHFDFCEVKFFYSNHSGRVKQRQFEGIFLDDELNVDSSIVLGTGTVFLTADFGHIDGTGGQQPDRDTRSSSPPSGIGFYALRIMDDRFVPLDKPFPYFTRASHKTMAQHPEQLLFVAIPFLTTMTWSYDGTVRRMNRKLGRYYGRTVR